MTTDVAVLLGFLAGALAEGWLRPDGRVAAARATLAASVAAVLTPLVPTAPAALGLAAGVTTFARLLPAFWDSSRRPRR